MRRCLALSLSWALAASPARAALVAEVPAAPAALSAAAPAVPVSAAALAASAPSSAALAAPAAVAAPVALVAPAAPTLRALAAAAPEAAGLRFDAVRPAAAAQAPAPGEAAPSASDAAPTLSPAGPGSTGPKRPGFWRSLNQSTRPRSRAENVFENGLGLGILAAVAAPLLWLAAPAHTLLATFPTALILPTLGLGALTFARVARFLRTREAPPPIQRSRGRTLALAAGLGLILGLGVGAGPAALGPRLLAPEIDLIEPASHTQAVPGDALGQEVVEDFSGNPVGREILDGLRDRSGRIRLPDFYVSDQTNSIAGYRAVPNGVFLSKSEIRSSGWTVEQFLADPALQRKYIRDNQALLAHELTHADQARRSPLEPGQFGMPVEYEYEAYLNEHLYTHARLKADPLRTDLGDELGSYQNWIDYGWETSLRDVDSSYREDTHVRSPRLDALFARVRAEWPAHQVEGHLLLARRFANVPALARRHLADARRIAAANGLPPPAP